MKYISFLLLSIVLVCTSGHAQTKDSVPCFSCKEAWRTVSYDSYDSVAFVPHYDPAPFFPTPNQLLLGVDDSIIRLEYKRGKCLVVVTDDSTGVVKEVYLSKIKYSHGSLKERKQGYCCQFDEQGRLVSITEYGRHKKKYRYDLNWDSEKKRYY
ncbi:MAG: hypothetical protein K6F40_02125 [Bacteroidales bacterium]|nr:hypothetical protein [Bacteroidales bacterium]